jgi:hypothetical protein
MRRSDSGQELILLTGRFDTVISREVCLMGVEFTDNGGFPRAIRSGDYNDMGCVQPSSSQTYSAEIYSSVFS